MANSDSVDIDALRASLPKDALFVFFNSVFKVLDRPFDGHALLVARSGAAGANIVRRREVGNVVGYFASDRFLGIMSVRASSHEKIATPSDFGGVPTGQLDLAAYFADFYPPDHMPSTGFALAVWLCELGLGQGSRARWLFGQTQLSFEDIRRP